MKKVFYADFDKNGRKEAFVLTGKKVKYKYEDGSNTLWFGYCSGGKAHIKRVKRNAMITSHTLKLKSATLFCAGRYSTACTPETVYRVKKNSVKKIFQGDSVKKSKGDNFTSVCHSYDSRLSYGNWTGHTYKPYYFYYKSGKVYEYKAKKLTKSQFLNAYENAADILKRYKRWGTFTGAYERSNGKVHVNFAKSYSDSICYSNVTYDISGSKLRNPVEDEGIYRATHKG